MSVRRSPRGRDRNSLRGSRSGTRCQDGVRWVTSHLHLQGSAQHGMPAHYLDPVSHLPPLEKKRLPCRAAQLCVFRPLSGSRSVMWPLEVMRFSREKKKVRPSFSLQEAIRGFCLTFRGALGSSEWPLPTAATHSRRVNVPRGGSAESCMWLPP